MASIVDGRDLGRHGRDLRRRSRDLRRRRGQNLGGPRPRRRWPPRAGRVPDDDPRPPRSRPLDGAPTATRQGTSGALPGRGRPTRNPRRDADLGPSTDGEDGRDRGRRGLGPAAGAAKTSATAAGPPPTTCLSSFDRDLGSRSHGR